MTLAVSFVTLACGDGDVVLRVKAAGDLDAAVRCFDRLEPLCCWNVTFYLLCSHAAALHGLHRRIVVQVPPGDFGVHDVISLTAEPASAAPRATWQHRRNSTEIVLRGAGPRLTTIRLLHGARALTVLRAHTQGPCDTITIEAPLLVVLPETLSPLMELSQELTILVTSTAPDVVGLDFKGVVPHLVLDDECSAKLLNHTR